MAKRSILIASVYSDLLSSLMVAYTGDESARTFRKLQPVKFASMEALYEGKNNAGLIAFGVLKDTDKKLGDKNVKDFAFKIEIPDLLSVLTGGDKDAYVPGLNDHFWGNEKHGIMSTIRKNEKWQICQGGSYFIQRSKANKDTARISDSLGLF